MTRQEFTDAVAQLLGLHPGVEMQVDTITRLADAYADTQITLAVDAFATATRAQEISRDDHLQLPRLRRGPER